MQASDANIATLEAAIHELALALPPVNATRYLSVAGFVVMLYDHILLFPKEYRNVWAAKWTWSKFFFLLNRYSVPILFLFDTHMLSGLSSAGLNTDVCRGWLLSAAILGITSVGILNVFVAWRVWALWAHSHAVRNILIVSFIVVYSSTYASVGVAFKQIYGDLSYSPLFRTCILTVKRDALVATYAIPILLDVIIFLLTCYNAFDRPRHMEAALTRQLITDGIIYFVALSCLRILNISILAGAGVAYSQLGIHFLWTMIMTLVNRMLITSGVGDVHPGSPSGRETPFSLPSDEPFDDEDYSPWPASFFENDVKHPRADV